MNATEEEVFKEVKAMARNIGFNEGRGYQKLLEDFGELIGVVRHFSNCARPELNGDIERVVKNTLGAAKAHYTRAKGIEEFYPSANGEAKRLLDEFVGEHSKLCEYLTSQKPWGAKQ